MKRYQDTIQRTPEGERHLVIFTNYMGQKIAMCECPTQLTAWQVAERMNAEYEAGQRPIKIGIARGEKRQSVRYFAPDAFA